MPAATPVTTPVPETTVATEPLELVQVPPLVVLPSEVVLPSHTDSVPEMAEGVVFTVTTAIDTQLDSAYEMIAVPAATPVTTPEASTVAFDKSLLDHAPPPVLFVSVVAAPVHTEKVPPIAAGEIFTVSSAVTKQPVETV